MSDGCPEVARDLPSEMWTPQMARTAPGCVPCQGGTAASSLRNRRLTPCVLVRKVGSVSRVAKDLDLTETALRKWVQQAEIDEGRGCDGALTTEEMTEIQQLRRKNRTLRMERDFLIKAAAFFAKENDRPSS